MNLVSIDGFQIACMEKRNLCLRMGVEVRI